LVKHLPPSFISHEDRVQWEILTLDTHHRDELPGARHATFADSRKQSNNAQSHGASDDVFAKVDAETAAKIQAIKEQFATNKGAVVEKLITSVLACTPKPHVNVASD
jgi:hypothetical protein